MADQPSFFNTLMSGTKGMAKGAAILGGIGLVTGALLSFVFGGAPAVIGGAIGFALMGGAAGSLIGAFTGVAQSREIQAADPQDIINLANITFAQGVAVGRSKELSKQNAVELEQAASSFREKIASEQKTESAIIR